MKFSTLDYFIVLLFILRLEIKLFFLYVFLEVIAVKNYPVEGLN